MYPTKARVRELQARFDVKNGQVFEPYRYKNLNWYLGHSSKPTDFENLEWFCFGDIRDEDIDRLRKLLVVDEKLVLGWKDLPPDQGDDRVPLDESGKNKVWLYIISFGVMLDNREGWQRNHVFTLDPEGKPVWEKIITAEGAQ